MCVPISARQLAEMGTERGPLLHAGNRAWPYPFLRTHTQLHRTRFCGPPPFYRASTEPVSAKWFASEGVPVSAVPLAETGTRALQVSGESLWLIRLFTRRNRYGGLRGLARTALPPGPSWEVSAMKVVKTEPPRRTRPCCTVLVPPRASAETGTPTFHRTRSKRVLALLQIATVCGRRNRRALEPADLGTHPGSATSQNYAETGTHRLAPHGRGSPNGRFPRRNGYAGTRKTPQDCRRRALSVDNTVDNPMLSPQIPVRPVRRSRYGFAQKRVRSHAESGSQVRRIEYGFAPQT